MALDSTLCLPLNARDVHGRLFGKEVEFARHARQVARNLESGVGELECSAAVIAARVLRADEFFEDIEMRALEARTTD